MPRKLRSVGHNHCIGLCFITITKHTLYKLIKKRGLWAPNLRGWKSRVSSPAHLAPSEADLQVADVWWECGSEQEIMGDRSRGRHRGLSIPQRLRSDLELPPG